MISFRCGSRNDLGRLAPKFEAARADGQAVAFGRRDDYFKHLGCDAIEAHEHALAAYASAASAISPASLSTGPPASGVAGHRGRSTSTHPPA